MNHSRNWQPDDTNGALDINGTAYRYRYRVGSGVLQLWVEGEEGTSVGPLTMTLSGGPEGQGHAIRTLLREYHEGRTKPTFFECFDCRKVAPQLGADSGECPICGKSNGRRLTRDQVTEGMGAGAYYNIDPRTGGPAKKK